MVREWIGVYIRLISRVLQLHGILLSSSLEGRGYIKMEKSFTHEMFSRERRDDPGKQKIDEGRDVIGMLTAF